MIDPKNITSSKMLENVSIIPVHKFIAIKIY